MVLAIPLVAPMLALRVALALPSLRFRLRQAVRGLCHGGSVGCGSECHYSSANRHATVSERCVDVGVVAIWETAQGAAEMLAVISGL